jgi:hypothetical protein
MVTDANVTLYTGSFYPNKWQNRADREAWSQCIGTDGEAGIFNVDFRAALSGNGSGRFEAYNETVSFNTNSCGDHLPLGPWPGGR